MPKDAKKKPSRRRVQLVEDARLLEAEARHQAAVTRAIFRAGNLHDAVALRLKRLVLALRRGARALREQARREP